MNKILLYPGSVKTATSTIQGTILSHHSEIFYLGKCAPANFPRGTANEIFAEIVDLLLWNDREQFDPARVRDLLDREVFSKAEDKLVVVSYEALLDRADFMKVVGRFEKLDIELSMICTIRQPLSWVKSKYLQELQGHYLKKNREHRFGPRPYLPINDWVRYVKLHERIRHVPNLRASMEALGQDRVKLLLFEAIKEDADEYYREFSRLIGVEPEESVRLAQDVFRNPRLTENELKAIRHADAWPWRRNRWRNLTFQERKVLMRNARKAPGSDKPARAVLSRKNEQAIMSINREDYAWLAKQTGLDFAGRGYPV